MTNLKRICQEIIAAGEKATARPWNATYEASFIVTSANHAYRIARAALVMEKALKIVARGHTIFERTGDWRDVADARVEQKILVTPETEFARQALAQCEEILK